MAIARPLLAVAAMIILAGGIVMEFFVVLSGSHIGTPVNQVFFLQANTGGISSTSANYHNPTRWTYLSICGVGNGLNYDCGPTHAALPFSPERNFGTTTGLPPAFIGTSHYYYLSRFAWAFYIVALFFAVVAFFLSIFAICARLGAYLTGVTCASALFFQTLCAALMTAWTVQARNAFKANNQNASLGVKAYGFTWGAMGCYLVATILFCVGGGIDKGSSRNKSSRSYFGRKQSTRSRGSFIDSESQRRVKDEYE